MTLPELDRALRQLRLPAWRTSWKRASTKRRRSARRRSTLLTCLGSSDQSIIEKRPLRVGGWSC